MGGPMAASELDHRQKKTRVGQAAAGSSVSQVLAVPTIANRINQDFYNHLDEEILQEIFHLQRPRLGPLSLSGLFRNTWP